LATGDVASIVKFENNAHVMITGGNNIGRIGILQSREKHPGSFEICHIKDAKGNIFSTRLGNVMVIGDNKNTEISLPKGEGIKLTLVEERAAHIGVEEESSAEEEDDN